MEFTQLLFIAFVILAFVYAIALLIILIGWSGLTHDQAVETDLISRKAPFISVVVAARNEAENIVQLIESLANQDLDTQKYEIIIADDHSEDNTTELVQELTHIHANLQLIRCSDSFGSGKKHALSRAIESAKGDIIVITDADCSHQSSWLRQHLSVYLKKEVQMVSGPVAFTEKKGFLTAFQEMEMACLMGLTGAMFAFNKPFLSNGANLSFRKEAFVKIGGFVDQEHYPSGDDIFLLHHFKNEFPKGIYFIKNPEAIVRTKPIQHLLGFYNQRLRWASKWKAFTSLGNTMSAVGIFILNALQIITLIFLLYGVGNAELWMTAMSLRLLSEWILIRELSMDLSQRFNTLLFLASYLFYPFYAVFFGIFATVRKRYHWKGRMLKINQND